jgi:hypothetical protein
VPGLIETSRELIERVGREAPRDNERGLLAAHPRNRLRWLSQFFYAPLASRAGRAMRLLGGAVVVLILVVLAVTAVRNAVEYHPIYLERLQSEAARSTQGAAPDGRPTQ